MTLKGTEPPRGDKRALAILDDPNRANKKGKGKGKDKGPRGPPQIPQGANLMAEGNKQLCVGYNRHGCKFGADCKFVHKCWWCGKDHPGGEARQCS